MTFKIQLAAEFTAIDGAYDDAAITQALSFAQSAVEGYTGRSFDQVTDDVVIIRPVSGQVLLPSYPVTEVTKVEGYSPKYVWVDLDNYELTPSIGLLAPKVACWTWSQLRVTYTHGLDVVPDALIAVACRLAQQYLENPAQMLQRDIGEQSARYAGSKGVPLSELDRAILDRFLEVGVA